MLIIPTTKHTNLRKAVQQVLDGFICCNPFCVKGAKLNARLLNKPFRMKGEYES